MKKWVIGLAAYAVLLAGCATYKGVPEFEDRTRPQVTIRDGQIAVSPGILFYFQDERNVTVVWQLPKDGRYTFPRENGIVIEGEIIDDVIRAKEKGGRDSVALDRSQTEIVECRARSEVEFTCLNRHTRPGVYKYTIRVIDRETRKTLERDPAFVNM